MFEDLDLDGVNIDALALEKVIQLLLDKGLIEEELEA